jgi:Zn-dependent M32 family carboxypeptidase
MNSSEAYRQLSAHSKEAAYLGSAIGLLHWDQRTQIPPEPRPRERLVLSYKSATPNGDGSHRRMVG